MKKYLVIGNPIEHSLSPELHNYWIKNRKINAIYEKMKITNDEIKDVISLVGKPSTIESNKDGSSFDGKAEKIIFYNDEKVHLIGNASIKYENISISSNMIIFNPETGQISSE